VYVDTNAIIYRVERIEPYLTASKPLWDALDAGLIEVVTSDLSLLEVLVKSLRDGNVTLVNLYRTVILGTAGLAAHPMTRSVLEAAARIRAQFGLKTPDAIHAASSQATGATLFITNDAGFRRVPGLPVEVLSVVASR
jgi:predicted nucleic acid-binding protein